VRGGEAGGGRGTSARPARGGGSAGAGCGSLAIGGGARGAIPASFSAWLPFHTSKNAAALASFMKLRMQVMEGVSATA
jgi:hypothetical protein